MGEARPNRGSRIRRQLAPARRQLTVVLVAGVLGSFLLVGQAWAVTELILAAMRDESPWGWAAVVVAVFVARAVVGWVTDASAARAAAVVGADVRRRVVRAILRDGGAGRSSGELAGLATRGATAAEPYLTRYVPALVLAGVLPVVTLVAIATQDPMSALIVLVTLPLIPVFGILVGLATQERARSQWRALASLSGHFLDVMRGLPTLVAFRRAGAAVGDDPRGHRPVPPADPADPADRVRLLGGPRAGRHAVGRAGRGHRRHPAGARRPGPRDRARRAAARPGGVLAAAPGRRWSSTPRPRGSRRSRRPAS